MRDVTIYRHEDGKARMIPWIDRENPTEKETNPEGAIITVFTTMPHDWISFMKERTEDEVNVILSGIIP